MTFRGADTCVNAAVPCINAAVLSINAAVPCINAAVPCVMMRFSLMEKVEHGHQSDLTDSQGS